MKETREAIGREIAIVGYATLGLFFIIALFSFSPFDPTLPIFNNFPLNRPPVNLAGLAGAFLAGLLVNFLGWPAFLAPFLFVFYAYQSYAREEPLAPGRLFFALLALVLLSGLVALAFQDRFSAAVTGREGFLTLVAPGGVAGCLLFRWGSSWLGSIGAALIYSALLLLLIFYALSLSLRPLSVPENRPAARKRAAPVPANAEPVFVPATTLEKPEKETAAPASGAGAPVPVLPPVPSGPADGNYHLPPLDLLIPAKEDSRPEFDLDRYKSVIEDTIADFGILVKAVEANVGPTVTMFELELSPGVMPQRIVSLQDNLAMALRATSVRVVAPLPGKSTVGVEVPNPTTSTVYLSEIVGAPEFGQHRSKIALALGKDTLGRPLIADLRNMPHILIAGATGSGKTVCLNSLLISFLYRATPEEVQLVLIDPKMVEMSVYNELPHLLLPVVTEARSAIDALKWMVGEMERRYRLFSQNNVRSIDVYNSRDVERIPYIVIVIDELADLITVARNDVESNIMRLSQLARAAST